MNKSGLFKKIGLTSILALAAMLCASCGGIDAGEEATAMEVTTAPETAISVSETAPETPSQVKLDLDRDLTITFIGDIATDHFFKDNYDRAGIEGVVSPEILEIFESADIFVANHEYCTTDISDDNKLTYQTWIEHVPTANDAMLKDLSVDLVSMANNHAFDYGLQGFIDTLDTLTELGIKYVGGGMDVEEATGPVVYEMGGKTVAFFSASSLLTERALAEWTATETQPGINVLFTWYSTYPIMEQKIKEAKEKYDYVIATTHWGVEGSNAFNMEEQYFAHTLIDLGVDVIIGGHAHVVQGIEYYNGGVVFYGLGNFLFAPEPIDTMIVSMTIDKNNDLSFKVTPCKSAYYYVQEAKDTTVYDIINNNSVNARVDSEGNVILAK